MERIEKVIKGIECCTEGGCRDCPYYKNCDIFDDYLSGTLLKDVLEVLKEQRPIKPVCFEHRRTRNKYQCGNCGSSEVFKEWEYCPWCGRELKWDE